MKKKCKMCKTTSKEYNYWKFEEDQQIYCDVCLNDLLEDHQNEWIANSWQEL